MVLTAIVMVAVLVLSAAVLSVWRVVATREKRRDRRAAMRQQKAEAAVRRQQNQRSARGELLISAVSVGDAAELRELVTDSGVDPNNAGVGEWTAMEEACFRDRPDLRRTLVELGAADIDDERATVLAERGRRAAKLREVMSLIGMDGMLDDAERGTELVEELRQMPLTEFETAVSDVSRTGLGLPLRKKLARVLVAVGHDGWPNRFSEEQFYSAGSSIGLLDRQETLQWELLRAGPELISPHRVERMAAFHDSPPPFDTSRRPLVWAEIPRGPAPPVELPFPIPGQPTSVEERHAMKQAILHEMWRDLPTADSHRRLLERFCSDALSGGSSAPPELVRALSLRPLPRSTPDLETPAREIASLFPRPPIHAISDEARSRVREIGEALGERGGHMAMVLVAWRAQHLHDPFWRIDGVSSHFDVSFNDGNGILSDGPVIRALEYRWEGICGWGP